ncbi:MAG: NADH-quinone oxidoreductase subunit A [Balneolaceae bacterium]|nr:NADH-quinone oxidoreductase subunit A [Balneolaceae bacterium]
MINNFGEILLFLILGILFVALALSVAKLIRPHRPNDEKLSTYECGEVPLGTARIQFNNRFYIIGLMFLIFEVEVLLLFPWAMVFKQVGWYAFWAMFVFVFLIFVGFAYELGKGNLRWDLPEPIRPGYIENVGVVDNIEEPAAGNIEPVAETESETETETKFQTKSEHGGSG